MRDIDPRARRCARNPAPTGAVALLQQCLRTRLPCFDKGGSML